MWGESAREKGEYGGEGESGVWREDQGEVGMRKVGEGQEGRGEE